MYRGSYKETKGLFCCEVSVVAKGIRMFLSRNCWVFKNKTGLDQGLRVLLVAMLGLSGCC